MVLQVGVERVKRSSDGVDVLGNWRVQNVFVRGGWGCFLTLGTLWWNNRCMMFTYTVVGRGRERLGQRGRRGDT